MMIGSHHKHDCSLITIPPEDEIDLSTPDGMKKAYDGFWVAEEHCDE